MIKITPGVQSLFAKFLIYFFSFFILIFINLIFVYKLSSYNEKVLRNQKILSEIDNSILTAKNTEITSDVLGETDDTTSISDIRVANLKYFFRKYNSPLYDYSEIFVKHADQNGFDYRLLPAIAMQESTLCKFIPINSYNCWGWGIYGNKVTRFASYEEAIDTISRGIKKEYIDKGLVTATAIMEKYTPSSTGSWAQGVNKSLKYIE